MPNAKKRERERVTAKFIHSLPLMKEPALLVMQGSSKKNDVSFLQFPLAHLGQSIGFNLFTVHAFVSIISADPTVKTLMHL